MNRNTLFVASLLALTLLHGVAIAAAPASNPAAAAKSQHARIDANGDGVIERKEAAQSPRLAEHFDQIDKNHDGRITADERPKHGEKHGGSGRGRHEGMAALDIDGDGRLSREELGRHPKFGEKFAAMDANRDGYLIRSELRQYRDKQRPQREAERAKRFAAQFDAADLNRDGKLSRVEVDGKLPRVAKGFAWMDENKDGFLSRSELQSSRHR